MNAATERPASLDALRGKLQALVVSNRRRWRAILLLEAVGWAVALPLAYIWVVLLLDSYLHLPTVGRLLAGAGVVAGIVWAGRQLLHSWRKSQFSEDEVALAMERRTTEKVHNRLINAVQLARETHGLELNEAVIQENVERLEKMHLEQAAHYRPALIWLGTALLMVLSGVGFYLLERDRFQNAASRIFMPLAAIDPIYRTRLEVEPGNIETVGDVPLKITIHGERPRSLTLLKRIGGKLLSEAIPVPAEGPVWHGLRDVQASFQYAVRGGDYTSPFFTVTVPSRVGLARVQARFTYPDYSRLAPQRVDQSTGDLEALEDSRAEVAFIFDTHIDEVRLVRAGEASQQLQMSGKEFATLFVFDKQQSYTLEIRQGNKVQKLGPFHVRVLSDQEPKLEWLGINHGAELPIDAEIPLQLSATDDFGLESVGLFYRRAGQGSDDTWQPIQHWSGAGQVQMKLKFDLVLAALNLAEGDKIELALRAQDNHPSQRWTLGPSAEILLGGDGVGLQRLYEQILRTEKAMHTLIKDQQTELDSLIGWLKKLDGSGDLRWDDPKNLAMLQKGIADLIEKHKVLQKKSGEIAVEMPTQAGNTRIALGLLTDTEMVRLQRILDSVGDREKVPAKRSAIADARVTHERIIRSLGELTEQYASFRSDWELTNMIPFTKMLAERQGKLRDLSKRWAALKDVPAYQGTSMERRQLKMLELGALIQPAFVGLSKRLEDQDASLAKATGTAGKTLASETFQKPMRSAAAVAKSGRWAEAVKEQTTAAENWLSLWNLLRKAQTEAAEKALADLREKAKSDLEAQKEIEDLTPGTDENFVKNFPKDMKLEDLQRIWEINRKKNEKEAKDFDIEVEKAKLTELDTKRIELSKDSGVRQDTDTLKLGSKAEATGILDMWKAKGKNKVEPFIQEKYDDLVGKLLDEADELSKKYQSIQLSTNQNNNDPGEISKNGGALNSTGAVAATGNKKPPTTESGGVARTGRQGARANGMVADQEVFNHRGRDKALEGQEQVADQAGVNKMKKTDENQTDFSTGVGGKKIESDDNHFSLKDAGKWKDEYVKRMDKPQQKNYLVERQGDPIDAKVAAQLYDLTSKQEQVIERLKSIKKELKNLYLPTEHLDEAAANLEANLESLKERPDADLFRMQAMTLDRLRGALRVFQGSAAGFQPSIPRERAIKGRVLDDPNLPALPGYEEAVRQYYLRLANP